MIPVVGTSTVGSSTRGEPITSSSLVENGRDRRLSQLMATRMKAVYFFFPFFFFAFFFFFFFPFFGFLVFDELSETAVSRCLC